MGSSSSDGLRHVIELARTKYERDGVLSLVRASVPYLADLIRRRSWLLYAIAYTRISGSNRIRYNGVSFDVERGGLPENLRRRVMEHAYERTEWTLLDRNRSLISGDVIELGGGIGFTACYISNHIDGVGQQIVVEANPELVPLLERMREINGAHFSIHNVAYAGSSSKLPFYKHDNAVSGSVREERLVSNPVEVEGVRLGRLAAQHEIDEFVLVVDIEGAEFDLIDAEVELLQDSCRSLFIEFHDFTDHDVDAYIRKLTRAGFDLIDQQDEGYAFTNGGVQSI